MPFVKHPKTNVTLFVGQKSYDEHMAAEKKAAADAQAKRKVTTEKAARQSAEGNDARD